MVKVNYVFEGGGVKGIGLVGALSVLTNKGGYECENVAGTSAGAIVASLLAAGYTPDELKTALYKLDFQTITKPPAIERIPVLGQVYDFVEEVTEEGLYAADGFTNLMRNLLADKGIHTFKDLKRTAENSPHSLYRLQVVASDITSGEMIVLPQSIRNYGFDPDTLDVATAVRMSMSIPFYFKPVKVKDQENQVHIVVDGGLLSNYPIGLFDRNGQSTTPTLGIRLVSSQGAKKSLHDITNPIDELRALVTTALEAHDTYDFEQNPQARTIYVDTKSVSATKFDLSTQDKDLLFNAGVAGAQAFLAMQLSGAS